MINTNTYIDIIKEIVVPIILALLAFWGGRKSSAEKHKLEFETEIASFKEFRTLLIEDNESLKKELIATQKSNRELKTIVATLENNIETLKKEIKQLTNAVCTNAEDCKNKK